MKGIAFLFAVVGGMALLLLPFGGSVRADQEAVVGISGGSGDGPQYRSIDDLPANIRQRVDELYAARNRKFTSLDGVVPEFSVAEVNVAEAVAKLSNEHNVLCGIEVVPWPADPKKLSGFTLQKVSLCLRNATPRQILNNLVLLDPTFAWVEDRGIANVVMRQALESPTYPLNIRLPAFHAKGRPYSTVFVGEPPSLLGLAEIVDRIAIGTVAGWPREFEPPVTVDAVNATPRQIINQVARELGMSWTVVWMGTDPDQTGRPWAHLFMVPHIEIAGPLRSGSNTLPQK